MIYDIDRIFVFKTWTSSSEGSERHAAWDVPKRGHGRRVFEKHMFYHVCAFDIHRYKSFYCVYLLSVLHIKIGAVLVCQYVKFFFAAMRKEHGKILPCFIKKTSQKKQNSTSMSKQVLCIKHFVKYIDSKHFIQKIRVFTLRPDSFCRKMNVVVGVAGGGAGPFSRA